MCFPGGHPEPEHVNGTTKDELFDSMIREIFEETGLTREQLGDLYYIGITRRTTNFRPVMAFFIRTLLSEAEISHLYEGAPDAFETTRIFCVSVSDCTQMNMPGCHQGVLHLFRNLDAV